MTINLIGTVRQTYRLRTGFWSFDKAFEGRDGVMGFPVRAMAEVYGSWGVGKSTLVYTLAGKIATALESGIAVADIEDHFDPPFITAILEHAGFSGDVYNATGDQSDAGKLEDMSDKLKSNDYCVGIVDSIGAISPISEVEGGFEDANMGRRAKLTAVLSRRIIHLSNTATKPRVVFCCNHVHPIMGGRGGTATSGGKVKEYLSTTRIKLSNKENFSDGSFLIGGKVDKNSFGYSKREFILFNLAGWGIHPGLTAVYDCLALGLAKQSRTVKLGDKSFGYMKAIIDGADDMDMFVPFQDALSAYSGKGIIGENDDE